MISSLEVLGISFLIKVNFDNAGVSLESLFSLHDDGRYCVMKSKILKIPQRVFQPKFAIDVDIHLIT